MNYPATVLLVEDEKGSRIMLTALLEAEGYRLVSCETAQEALGFLTAGETVDLVVSDLKLPDGSGLQVLWALKKIHPDAAFILMTGHATVETAIEAVNEGAYAYHVKPLDIDALTHNIRNALHQRSLSIENRELLQKLQMTNAELEENNRELEQASLAKTQILATVTHELKTPLTSIVGYIDRMMEQDKVGVLNERQERYLERAQRNSWRLKALIDNLLDISRIESGSLEFAPVELDLGHEIQEVVRSMQTQIDDKKIQVLVTLPYTVNRITADRLRFSQVISNLLSNACKYSPDNATVAITAKVANGTVQIDVADTGPGISQEDQALMFTKFYRVDNANTRGISGTGLGLFITKHIVEAQGGAIWLVSEVGKGSTFTFTLPHTPRGGVPEAAPEKVLPIIGHISQDGPGSVSHHLQEAPTPKTNMIWRED